MKRMLITVATLFAAVFVSLQAEARTSSTRNIDISVNLLPDGSADICEIWDMSIYHGTEWYLVRKNLGDMCIQDLSVSDETGREFICEKGWDIDRSLAEKEGRCGILHKSGGCEICWGLGSYGDHLFTVRYRMTNVVKSYDDYDALHVQFISSGIDPLPENASLTISISGAALNDTLSRVWTFGFEGACRFENGSIAIRTSAPFTTDRHSMIALVRFEKGLLAPASSVGGAFQNKLDEAFKGSSYKQFNDDKASEKRGSIIVAVLCAIGLGCMTLGLVSFTRRRNLKLFGLRKLKEIGWVRTIPFNGNLEETAYVLDRIGRLGSEANICSALVLQMIKNGLITVARDRKQVLLCFKPDADTSLLSKWQNDFYDMLRESAGEDAVLREKEFSKWSRTHSKRVTEWFTARQGAGVAALHKDGFVNGPLFTPDFQMHARAVVGFKKYLKDFTLISERSTEEVALWQDYIIFAALYGIADKVANDLKEINPQAFEQAVGYDYYTMGHVLYFSNRIGHGTLNALSIQQTASSVAGKGGFSSFGGGGGFSGGGHGGGAR